MTEIKTKQPDPSSASALPTNQPHKRARPYCRARKYPLENMLAFGAEVRRLRQEKGWSLETMATISQEPNKLSRPTLHRIETGKGTSSGASPAISDWWVRAIARTLDISEYHFWKILKPETLSSIPHGLQLGKAATESPAARIWQFRAISAPSLASCLPQKAEETLRSLVAAGATDGKFLIQREEEGASVFFSIDLALMPSTPQQSILSFSQNGAAAAGVVKEWYAWVQSSEVCSEGENSVCCYHFRLFADGRLTQELVDPRFCQ